MTKIIFTMDTGEKYTLSKRVLAGNQPLAGHKDARIQLSHIMENVKFFTADDDTVIMTGHISTANIIEQANIEDAFDDFQNSSSDSQDNSVASVERAEEQRRLQEARRLEALRDKLEMERTNEKIEEMQRRVRAQLCITCGEELTFTDKRTGRQKHKTC